MKLWLPILACGAILTASACSKVVMPMGLSPVLSSARLYYDDGPGFPDSVRMAVRDQTTFEDVWARATYSQPSPPPIPVVDFTNEMILVVAAGRMNPGDQIRVDSIGVRGDFYVVVVRTIVQCQPFPADAYPLEIVRVPREERPVTFSERRERAAQCT